MKTVIAYSLVVIGLPILAGQLFGVILNMPITLIVGLSRRAKETPSDAEEAPAKDALSWMFGKGEKMAARDVIAHASLDILTGFGAILAAGLLFHLFGLAPNVAILLIVASWELFFTLHYAQSKRVLLCSLAGIAVGWFVILRLFSV